MDENGGVRKVAKVAFHDMYSFVIKCEMVKHILCYLQSQLMSDDMTKKGENMESIVEYDLDT